jgi:HD-GYP domain-containing protein (c-di-GMP phosphodiesterase class II)
MSPNNEKFCGGINDNYSINLFLISLITEVQKFTENQQALIKRLTEIGTALSAEKNLDRLLEMIVDEARKFTNADAGTLYIMSDDETELNFAIVQNNSLGMHMGGTGREIIWPSVNLKNTDGSANNANVSAYVAISGEPVNIADVYDAEGFNFEGTKEFDRDTGYRSKSMLVIPLRNHENDIIGVLQLLNALDPATGEVIVFSPECQEMTLSLASQAAVSLSNNRLILDMENLLESFIRTIATAIDEKSPYTGGHVRRVAKLTMNMARKINSIKYGKFAGMEFSDDQLLELRIAAWLHDVGKITTPEYVIDKATKLEAVHDRIHDVKTRMELIKKDSLPTVNKDAPAGETAAKIEALDDDYQFLFEANIGSEFLDDDKIARVKEIAKRKWTSDGQPHPLLSDEEVYNLCIRRGTLNKEERTIVNNHVLVTHKMLSHLPFPKKLRHVADYAGAHHEKVDGTGYPLGLKGDQLSLQSRIIAIADIFEALTAKDRPYKKGKSLAEALKIMEAMAKDNHIDADLYELFVKEKVYEEYAQRELVPQQTDE